MRNQVSVLLVSFAVFSFLLVSSVIAMPSLLDSNILEKLTKNSLTTKLIEPNIAGLIPQDGSCMSLTAVYPDGTKKYIGRTNVDDYDKSSVLDGAINIANDNQEVGVNSLLTSLKGNEEKIITPDARKKKRVCMPDINGNISPDCGTGGGCGEIECGAGHEECYPDTLTTAPNSIDGTSEIIGIVPEPDVCFCVAGSGSRYCLYCYVKVCG